MHRLRAAEVRRWQGSGGSPIFHAMSDYELPELPSDEELGIAGLSDEKPRVSKEDNGTPEPPSRKRATGPGDRGPRWRGWVTLAVLLVAAWASSSYRQLPSPRAANAPDSLFSSGRALSTLVEIAQRPRPTGSPEHDRVRELLLDRLREAGLEPRVQETTKIRSSRIRARAATVRNVMVRIPGSESTGAVVLTAHYDAVPGSPGAGDDATGVAAILETLRALQDGPALRNDLIILFTDFEEGGLLGARAFVEDHPWMADVQAVVSVEMRGAGGPSIMFETGPENGWIVQRLQEADPLPLANSASMEIYRRLPNDTDFTPFREVGIQGLNFAAIGRANRYHQPTDTPENLQEATLQHHGTRVLAMVRALGNADLSTVTGPDRSYTVLPFLGMVSLPTSLTLPVTAGLLVALLLITFLASIRGTRSRGFLLAAILSAAALGLAAGAGWALLRWVLPLHPVFDTGSLTPPVHVQGPYFVALMALAVGITVSLFSLGHRWMSPLEATLGALLFPVVALVAITFMAPAAAINLQGPLAATTLLLALLTGVGLHRARGSVAWVASLLLALPVLAFLVPLLEMAGLALTLRAAPILASMYVLLLLFILPALSALDHPNRWWAPLTAFVVAAGAVGTGWLQRNASAEHPLPSTLLYAMERDGEGLPSTARWLTSDGPGATWAAEVTDGAFGDTTTLPEFGLSRSYLTREAPLAAIPAPEVQVLSDTVVAGERRVTVGVRSRIGAEYLVLELPEGVDAQGIWGASTGGPRPGVLPPSVRTLEHWGRTDGPVRLDLVGSPDADWTLDIIENHLRPGEVFGPGRFTRPAELTGPGPSRSDRLMVRTPWPIGRPLASGAASPVSGTAPSVSTDSLASPPDSASPADPGGSAAAADSGAATDSSGVPDSVSPAPPDTGRTGLPPDTTGRAGGGTPAYGAPNLDAISYPSTPESP